MTDRNISATTTLAVLMWMVGAALALTELFTHLDIGELGIVIAAAGATMNVRGFFCHIAYRERNAFELGREYEEGRVTSLRKT